MTKRKNEVTECKIGNLAKKLPQKFLVAREGNALVFYSGYLFDPSAKSKGTFGGIELGHNEIAQRHGLTSILGGGLIVEEEGELCVGGSSASYGRVPDKTLQKFENLLREAYGRDILFRDVVQF